MITLRNDVGQEGGCLCIDGECPELQGDLNQTMYNRKREIEDCESRECDASPLQRIDHLNRRLHHKLIKLTNSRSFERI